MRAGIAADAGEAVLQHAAGEEVVGDLCEDGATWAILAREAVVVDRLPAAREPPSSIGESACAATPVPSASSA